MLLETQALLNQVEIVFESATEELIIDCVENQLKQVFINLVKNAIEAMPNGGTVSVHLTLSGDEEVLLTVQDQGVGIPEEKLARLGEPFYTTKDKGTYLGLMVSFKIVEQHGGAIRYRSTPGQGTTAEIHLPLRKSPMTDAT
ncbi:ATP-binding protein [Alicyclobacillus sacchari]|uniref:ATP-binding protein n=1 Tax=Alicyclobacillus sacchari TaxID=392010 RepID=UPI0024E16716|nr:ATP-binding protein [Alicyclobacillus sacchari]